MVMSNANLAVTLKRVAQNVSDIIKKKQKLQEQMNLLEQKYKEKLELKLVKLKEQYDGLSQQQEIFEKPIRECTGGYSTEDLIETKVVEAGTDKNGRVIRKTTYALRYPETIIPPALSDNNEEATNVDLPVDTMKSTYESKEVEIEDELAETE